MEWLSSLGTIASAVGMSTVVAWMLGRKQRERDAERQDRAEDRNARAEAQALWDKLRDCQQEMEARLTTLSAQHAADIAGRDAHWEAKCAELVADVQALARKIARYERSNP